MTSIRDIAKMAGVSAASVSRILNNDQTFSINENTRQRVIDVANKANYSTDKNRRGVRSVGDDLTIALIVRHSEESEINDPYFQHIRLGIEKEAAKWRLRVVRAFRMHDEDKDWEQLQKYGAVIMIGDMTTDALEKIYGYNPKLILVDNYANHPKYDCIQTDFDAKTHEILTVLHENHHENIAFIGGLGSKVNMAGQSVRYTEEIRAEQYREWMKLHNLERFSAVYQGNWSTENAVELAEQMLATTPRPTAVVVASDPMAVGVYKAISDAGLKIPEDISVASFDDIQMAKFMVPSLTSIWMNAEEMGRLAVTLSKERILGERSMPIRVTCASELKVRGSVGKRSSLNN